MFEASGKIPSEFDIGDERDFSRDSTSTHEVSAIFFFSSIMARRIDDEVEHLFIDHIENIS